MTCLRACSKSGKKGKVTMRKIWLFFLIAKRSQCQLMHLFLTVLSPLSSPAPQKEVMFLEFLAAGNCMQNTAELSSEISKAGKK